MYIYIYLCVSVCELYLNNWDKRLFYVERTVPVAFYNINMI